MRTMTILVTACTVALAAVAGGVSLASASTEATGAKTLTLVSESTEIEQYVDNGKPGESIGDIVFFQENLYDKARGSKRVGHSEIMCYFIGDDGARCSGTFFLPEGKIEAGGAIHFRRASRIPVLGGTGAYAGARGELTLTEINERRDRSVIRLLP
jgi:allene oxide cyclase